MSDGLPEIHVVGAAIIDGGRCLVMRRGPHVSSAGKWEFPGGKVRAGEAPATALARELHEELGVRAEVGALIDTGVAPNTTGEVTIRLEVYRARIVAGRAPSVIFHHSAVVLGLKLRLANLSLRSLVTG